MPESKHGEDRGSSKHQEDDDETTTAPPSKTGEGKAKKKKHSKKKKKRRVKKPKENVDDLWIKLLKGKQEGKCVSAELRESNLIVVGSRGSGKSTLIHSFLRKDSDFKGKATAALEYTFARRNVGHDKEVAHVWELGGGVKSNELLNSTFEAEKLDRTSLIVVLDSSNPGQSFFVLKRWMDILRSHVEKSGLKLREEKVETYNTLKRNALEPYEKDEPNDVSIVPVLIVMSHYEAFLEKASLKRRVVTNAIRVLAHTWGANVAGYDRRTKTTALMRSMLSKAAFGGDVRAKKKKKEESAAGDTGNETNATADPDQKQKEEKKGRVKLRRFGLSKKMIKLDAQAPIVVPVGADSHESIGAPPECDASEYATMSDSLKIKMWSKAVLKYYPDADREDLVEEGEDEDESKKSDKFTDEVIDALCAQKREELIKYRKASERQRRLKGEGN
eukprot:g3163.t1